MPVSGLLLSLLATGTVGLALAADWQPLTPELDTILIDQSTLRYQENKVFFWEKTPGATNYVATYHVVDCAARRYKPLYSARWSDVQNAWEDQKIADTEWIYPMPEHDRVHPEIVGLCDRLKPLSSTRHRGERSEDSKRSSERKSGTGRHTTKK